jgi:hypothetical protein
MTTANAAPGKKTVADAVAEYDTLRPLWSRSRAVCSGERHVKAYDSIIDPIGYGNLLIPFSPSMTQQQYNFYKAEAELPGIVAQFVKTIIGGLLRKQPVLKFGASIPEDAYDWLMNEFAQDGAPMSAFLDPALYEELQTSRAWVYIDHPKVSEDATPEQIEAARPYPVLWRAEQVINWKVRHDGQGRGVLERVITSAYEEQYSEEYEFHPEFVHTIRVHELKEGKYQIRVYQPRAASTVVPVVAGQKQSPTAANKPIFDLVETIYVKIAGEPMTEIPAWPLNGMIDPVEPLISSFVDKEIALYNKVSRRNHLLYGASTYTPVISSDMGDEDFQAIVDGGLGTWIHLRQGDKAEVLKTPTEALQDMDRAIAASIEEMAKMGIRMLSPETAQSGVALDIRNAAQNAQMGVLNTKISNTMRQIIAFMIRWKYNIEIKIDDVQFELSADFNPTPLGADWLRLATEWYEKGLIPRSVWLQILKQNDMLSPDYDDEAGKQEITADMDAVMKATNPDYAKTLEK